MNPKEDSPLTPVERLRDKERIYRALRDAAAEAVERHRQAGVPIATWRDGKVVLIQPEDIPPRKRRGETEIDL